MNFEIVDFTNPWNIIVWIIFAIIVAVAFMVAVGVIVMVALSATDAVLSILEKRRDKRADYGPVLDRYRQSNGNWLDEYRP
jgi:hypothetical protein